ncbi:hypothetical protein ACVWWG_008360 [Bradyrhizobium sp. LB7.2]
MKLLLLIAVPVYIGRATLDSLDQCRLTNAVDLIFTG